MKLKPGFKIPVCYKCGRVMKGQVPADAEKIECFFCANPRYEGDDATNQKDMDE